MVFHLSTFDAPTAAEVLILLVLGILLVIEAYKARGLSTNVLILVAAIIVVLIIFSLLF